MSVYNAELHCMMPSPAKAPPASSSVSASADSVAGANTGGDGEDFLHHILDVINPLQHLPVVGTIYRAITGEHIGPIEKIAGDALYGGLWGAVTAVADVAFESITGKSVEDTALAWLKDDDSSDVAVAGTKVAAPVITASTALPSGEMPALPSAETAIAANTAGMPAGFDVSALSSALAGKGVNGELASRALYAYQRSMGRQTPVPVLASIN